MTPPLDPEKQEQFTAALVSEIKAEMGRRDLSSRGLSRLIGQSSQYVSMRLDGGNSKTGRLVALTVSDVAAIASAFDMEPFELMQNAQATMVSNDELATRRAKRVSPSVKNTAARKDRDPDD